MDYGAVPRLVRDDTKPSWLTVVGCDHGICSAKPVPPVAVLKTSLYLRDVSIYRDEMLSGNCSETGPGDLGGPGGESALQLPAGHGSRLLVCRVGGTEAGVRWM